MKKLISSPVLVVIAMISFFAPALSQAKMELKTCYTKFQGLDCLYEKELAHPLAAKKAKDAGADCYCSTPYGFVNGYFSLEKVPERIINIEGSKVINGKPVPTQREKNKTAK